MKICPRCGKPNRNVSVFCVACGAPITNPVSETVVRNETPIVESARTRQVKKNKPGYQVGQYLPEVGGVVIKSTLSMTLVISLKAAKLRWADYSELEEPAPYSSDKQIANYPALSFASNDENGMALPSLKMLKELSAMKDEDWEKVNKSILEHGGTPLAPKSAYEFYWSSDENLADPSCAGFVCMSSGYSGYHSKCSVMNVRLMKIVY